MEYVLAVIVDAPQDDAVAMVSRHLATIFDAQVSGMRAYGPRLVPGEELADRWGFAVRDVANSPLSTVLDAAASDDVILVAIGLTEHVDDTGDNLHLVMDLAEQLHKPLLVVPDECDPSRCRPLTRVLIPLDGDPNTTTRTAELAQRLRAAAVEIVVAHVFDRKHLPREMDEHAHGIDAWLREFSFRHCAFADRIEVRRGSASEAVLACAADVAADMIILAWSQRLDPGRARVVKRVISNSEFPVLLLPDHAEVP